MISMTFPTARSIFRAMVVVVGGRKSFNTAVPHPALPNQTVAQKASRSRTSGVVAAVEISDLDLGDANPVDLATPKRRSKAESNPSARIYNSRAKAPGEVGESDKSSTEQISRDVSTRKRR